MVKLKNSYNKRKIQYLLSVFFLSLFTACNHNTESAPDAIMNISDRLEMLFEKTKTICFGHFLVQIPSTATLVYGPTEVDGEIFFYEGQARELEKHLTKRLNEIEKERRFLLKRDIPKLPLFGNVLEGGTPGQKISFGSKDQINYAIDSFIPIKNDLFIHEFYIAPEENYTQVNILAKQLRLRKQDEIPEEPGMCIEGGFISGTHTYERATIGIRIKEFPDVHISIDAHKNLDYLPEGTDPILLREQAKQSADAEGLGTVFSRTKILRQRPRQIANWNGVELALRTPRYKDDKSVHEFRFHSMGAVNDSLHPELDIRFDSGVKDNAKGRVEPSITDEEALALWDKLITTIRIRQPSDATRPKTPKVPLASRGMTGDVCSETGWWECEEGAKTSEGKRRFLKKGDPMPHALLVDETSFWNRITRTRAVRQVATVWNLVAYEDEPGSLSTTV